MEDQDRGNSMMSISNLRGGYARTRPMVLFVGTILAVVWDVVAFRHLFHASLSTADIDFWWPWVLMVLAPIALVISNKKERVTPWVSWALLGLAVLAVAGDTQGMALSMWCALAIALWPQQGRPWWWLFGVMVIIHVLTQWGLLFSLRHLPTSWTIATTWVTGIGMLIALRGTNWSSSRGISGEMSQ